MLKLKNISKNYKDFNLRNVSFSVEDGEYFVLLGRSGAGKSLLLEIITGLTHPDKGMVIIDNEDVTEKNIQNRNIGLVFQDYAIFPHLSVYDNVAYPLKSVHKSTIEIKQKVKSLAAKTGISELLNRKPKTLSGGELQRVALARTLASDPKYLLLDEPFSSLDIQLRVELQRLLRKINKEGLTIIHVTHNFEEAIALADKVGVINKGKIIQVGTPKDVFHNPKSRFVANFTGIKNFYNAVISAKDSILLEDKVKIVCISGSSKGEGVVLFRSEDIVISKSEPISSMQNNFKGNIVELIPTKNGVELLIDVGIKISALVTQQSVEKLSLSENDAVWVGIKASAIKFIPNSML